MVGTTKPWVGREYKAGLVPLRILILGDSHHGDVTSVDPNDTIRTIENYLEKTTRSYAFFTRLMAAFGNEEYWKLDRSKFYNSISFFNYIDGIAVPHSSVRPDARQFEDSVDRVIAELDRLDPDLVFCCGSAVRYHLTMALQPQQYEHVEFEGLSADYAKVGARLYLFAKHPSRGFSGKWKGIISRVAEAEGLIARLEQMRKTWRKSS